MLSYKRIIAISFCSLITCDRLKWKMKCNCKNKLAVSRKVCNFAASFNRKERPKESAFPPYSDRVNLDHLRINREIRNTGVTRCSHGSYYTLDTSICGAIQSTFIFISRGVQTLTREDRDINGWLHFLRCVIFIEP